MVVELLATLLLAVLYLEQHHVQLLVLLAVLYLEQQFVQAF